MPRPSRNSELSLISSRSSGPGRRISVCAQSTKAGYSRPKSTNASTTAARRDAAARLLRRGVGEPGLEVVEVADQGEREQLLLAAEVAVDDRPVHPDGAGDVLDLRVAHAASRRTARGSPGGSPARAHDGVRRPAAGSSYGRWSWRDLSATPVYTRVWHTSRSGQASAPSRSCRPPRPSCRRGSAAPGRTGARGRRGSGSSAGGRRRRSRRPARAEVYDVPVADPVSSSRNRSVCQASISSVMPLNVLPSITNPPRRVACAQVDVGEPALAAAAAPLDGEHDEVEGVPRLDLHPGRTPPARVVRRIEALEDHALLPVGDRPVEELLGLLGGGRSPVAAPGGPRAPPRRDGRAGRGSAPRSASRPRGAAGRRRTAGCRWRRPGSTWWRRCPGRDVASRSRRARSPRRRGSGRWPRGCESPRPPRAGVRRSRRGCG